VYRDSPITYSIAPLVAAGLISAGSAIVNSIIQNRNVNKQNEYNSPEAQMQRFRQAGLNPALIYSQGNAGNMASANYSSPTPDVDLGKGIAGAMNVLSTFQDLKVKGANITNTNAQTANLIKQNSLLDTEQAKYNADIAYTNQQTANARSMNDQIIANTKYRNTLNQIAAAKLPYADAMEAMALAGRIYNNELTRAKTKSEENNYQFVQPAQVGSLRASTAYQQQQTMSEMYRYNNMYPLDVLLKNTNLNKSRYETDITKFNRDIQRDIGSYGSEFNNPLGVVLRSISTGIRR